MRKHRIVGISFDHMHIGDLLREAHDHPNAEIVGICDPDPARMADAIRVAVERPLDPAICRTAQRTVDAAPLLRRTLPLPS